MEDQNNANTHIASYSESTDYYYPKCLKYDPIQNVRIHKIEFLMFMFWFHDVSKIQTNSDDFCQSEFKKKHIGIGYKSKTFLSINKLKGKENYNRTFVSYIFFFNYNGYNVSF